MLGAPNLAVTVVPNYFNRTGYTRYGLLSAWKLKVPTVYVYDLAYDGSLLSLPQPGFLDIFETVPRDIAEFRRIGVAGINYQSQYSGGNLAVLGLHWPRRA